MKYAALLLFAAAAAAQAEVTPRTADLRQVLQQHHPAGAPQPRQLSPAEREQLRRQLAEFAQPRGGKKK